MRKKVFLGCCVDLPGQAVTEMVDNARQITLAPFRRHTDAGERRKIETCLGYAIGRMRGLHLKDDYHVRFGQSRFRGAPCVYLQHSAIEWVFI